MPRASKCDLMLFLALLKPAVRLGLPLGGSLRRMSGEGGIDGPTLREMADEADEGLRLSESMARHAALFAPPIPAIVAAGEEAGDPAAALDSCLELLRRRMRATAQVRAALLYPGICLVLALGLLAAAAIIDPIRNLVGPGVTEGTARYAYDSLGLRWSTESDIQKISSALQGSLIHTPAIRGLLLLLALAAAAGVWILFSARHRTPLKDRLLLDLPLVGRLYRWSAAARFTRALGALLARDLPIDGAIERSIPACGNRWVENELRSRLAGVRDGERLARSIALPGVFPPSLAGRIALGEERGRLAEALLGAASAYEEDLAVYSGTLSRIAEPAAMIAVGLIAIVAVWVLFLPTERMLADLDLIKTLL